MTTARAVLKLIEIGFDLRICSLRSGRIGSLVELPVGDCGFERINGQAIGMNVDGLLPFMSVTEAKLKDRNFEQTLREALTLLDEKHDRRLSKGETRRGRQQWVNAQASYLKSLIMLTLELQGRSPGRSRSAPLLKLKQALMATRALEGDGSTGEDDGTDEDDDENDSRRHSGSESWPDYPQSSSARSQSPSSSPLRSESPSQSQSSGSPLRSESPSRSPSHSPPRSESPLQSRSPSYSLPRSEPRSPSPRSETSSRSRFPQSQSPATSRLAKKLGVDLSDLLKGKMKPRPIGDHARALKEAKIKAKKKGTSKQGKRKQGKPKKGKSKTEDKNTSKKGKRKQEQAQLELMTPKRGRNEDPEDPPSTKKEPATIRQTTKVALKRELLRCMEGPPAGDAVAHCTVVHKIENGCALFQITENIRKNIVGQVTAKQGGEHAEALAHAIASLRCSGWSKAQLMQGKKGFFAAR